MFQRKKSKKGNYYFQGKKATAVVYHPYGIISERTLAVITNHRTDYYHDIPNPLTEDGKKNVIELVQCSFDND